ncbi:DNA endonuclease RBBP8 [Pungitius pungitius]|uniref:DNA endonuclease RBBP8 n=1 Tax=Pungitius pungitius TaxID=134920 RepID=UPI002E0F0D16
MSSGDPHPSDLFDKLWGQLRESHRNALQEAEDKVSKLKTARYLDAESLQAFHSRTQKLKEENKTLQDTITGLEERLCTRECDRCAVLEENLKNNQDQNLRLIAKLKNERESLEDENRQLHAELQKIKISRLELQQASTSEQEDGIIPDSPILMSSLPAPNKLRKQKDVDKRKHVRYAEMPLPCKSLFSALDTQPVDATKNPGRPQVLVPDTCVLDSSQVLNDVNPNQEDAIAETCALELGDQPHAVGRVRTAVKSKTTAGQQRVLQSSWKHGFRLKPYHLSPSPSALSRSAATATEKSPSLLQSVKRFSEDGSSNKAKRKKEESEPEVQEEDKRGIQEGVDKPNEGRKIQPQLIKQSSTRLASPLREECLVNGKDPSAQNRTLSQKPNVSCISPVFKKPDVKAKSILDFFTGRRPTWSIDPALALSMYDSEWRGDEQKEKEEEEEEGCGGGDDDDDEEECHGELLDSDRTWVSHSLLPCRGEAARDQRDGVSGLGEKANDSLDMMFDTTAHGEYQSCNNSHLDHSQPGDGDDDDDDDDDGEEDNDQHAQEKTMNKDFGHKAGRPAFAHMAVVRKKDERRKLKGATCKECELYYAHLTEEERQVKLSACSRHRFLYVPPSTPENFWEVGFPSTQTCIERGYIKEEKKPQARSRRRQPFNALFSQKQKQQQS